MQRSEDVSNETASARTDYYSYCQGLEGEVDLYTHNKYIYRIKLGDCVFRGCAILSDEFHANDDYWNEVRSNLDESRNVFLYDMKDGTIFPGTHILVETIRHRAHTLSSCQVNQLYIGGTTTTSTTTTTTTTSPDKTSSQCSFGQSSYLNQHEGEKPPASPFVPLTSWSDIVAALNEPNGRAVWKNDTATRDKIRKLNEQHNGPIRLPQGKGTQPSVDKAALLSWWDGLREHFDARRDEEKAEAESARLTVSDSHNYGESGKVVPGISGSEKHTRANRPY